MKQGKKLGIKTPVTCSGDSRQFSENFETSEGGTTMKKLLATMLQSAVNSVMSAFAFTPQQTLVTAGPGAMSMTSGTSRQDTVVRRDQGHIDQLMGRHADAAVDFDQTSAVHHASTDLGTFVDETGAPHAVATTVSQRI